jgi:hypothetical protein
MALIDRTMVMLRTVTEEAGIVQQVSELIEAAKADLTTTVDVVLPDDEDDYPANVGIAIQTYVAAHFDGDLDRRKKFQDAYDDMKTQLRVSSETTDYTGYEEE